MKQPECDSCIYYEICKDYKDMECVHKETLALTEWLKEMNRGTNYGKV